MIENLVLYFFYLKHRELLQSFPHMAFFVMIFFKIIYQFYIFNIKLVENYNCIFPHKTL